MLLHRNIHALANTAEGEATSFDTAKTSCSLDSVAQTWCLRLFFSHTCTNSVHGGGALGESTLPHFALLPCLSVYVSNITHAVVSQLFDLVDEVAVQHRRRVKTSVLNEVSGGYVYLPRLLRCHVSS